MSVKEDNMSVENQMQESAADLKTRLLRQMAERIGIKVIEFSPEPSGGNPVTGEKIGY